VYVTNQSSGSVTVIEGDTSVRTVTVGGAPTGVAVSPDGRHAYVVDNDEHALLVVDADAGRVAATISVGKRPAQVAITPDAGQAFVTNAAGGSVSVIDLATAVVAETLVVSAHPIGVAIDTDGRFAYVTALDASRLTGTVTSIDVVTGTTTTSRAGAPYGIAVHPGGDHAYITDFRTDVVSKIVAGEEPIDSDELAEVDLVHPHADRPRHRETVRHIAVGREVDGVTADPAAGRAFIIHSDDNAVEVVDGRDTTATVKVGDYPTAVVLSADSTRAYVTNYDDCSVSVVDTAPDSASCNTVTATLDVGRSWSTGVALSDDGTRAYAVDEEDGQLSVIDTVAGSAGRDTIVARIDVGEPLAALRLTPNGRWIYAVNYFDYALFAVNTTSHWKTRIPLPSYPYRISMSPNGLRLYASLEGDGSTCVIDTDARSVNYHRVIARLHLGGHLPSPVFTTAGARAYVLNSDRNCVSVIDTATSAVKNVAVGHYPWDVAVSPNGRWAYVVNYLDNSMSILSAADAVTRTVAVGARPCRVAVSGDGTRAFVVNTADDSVSVVDTAAARVVDTVAVGRSPFELTLSADGARVCVHHRDGLSMVAI
jgi:YVTN family beta-propeller protein